MIAAEIVYEPPGVIAAICHGKTPQPAQNKLIG
jgi:hypothetical protein